MEPRARLKELMNRAILRSVLAAAAALAAAASPLLAQPGAYAPRGYYLGVAAHTLSFQGDLDGRLVLVNSLNRFNVPRLADGVGAGIFFGCDVRKGYWRVSYLKSLHRAAFAERSRADASWNTLALDGLGYLVPSWRVTPYVSVGIDVSWLNAAHGALTPGGSLPAPRTTRAETFGGLGINGGFGVCARIGSNLFLMGGAVSRWTGLMYAYGEGKGRDVANLYINDTGKLQPKFLRVLGLGVEIALGFRL